MRARCGGTRRWADEDGQIVPLLLLVLLATLAFGILFFQVGRAAVFRSDAQTAADSAALAGAKNIETQLKRQLAATGVANPMLINDLEVRAASEVYARRNDARITKFSRTGVAVRINVQTNESLGEDAEPANQEDARGHARARAALTLTGGIAGLPLPSLSGGGGGGGTSGSTDISASDWDELREQVGKPPFSSREIVMVGKFLQGHGMLVAENSAFGGVAPVHGHYGVNDHYHDGAIDVNLPSDAAEATVFDQVEPKLAELGFNVIWREPNHAPGDNSHMHVDIGPGGQGGGPRPGGGGGLGGLVGFPLGGDSLTEVKLVTWEGDLGILPGLGGGGGGGIPFGNPDMEIACKIYSYVQDRDLGPRMLLAAMETAIVESGIQNLTWGDRDSLGVFQQRPSVGEWGTAAQIMDVDHAIMAFFRSARRFDTGQPAAALAAATQRSAFDERYGQVEASARDVIGKMEDGCKGGSFKL